MNHFCPSRVEIKLHLLPSNYHLLITSVGNLLKVVWFGKTGVIKHKPHILSQHFCTQKYKDLALQDNSSFLKCFKGSRSSLKLPRKLHFWLVKAKFSLGLCSLIDNRFKRYIVAHGTLQTQGSIVLIAHAAEF